MGAAASLDRRPRGIYYGSDQRFRMQKHRKGPARMKMPTSCGEAYELLVRHYGTEDLAELSRLSSISRSTLAYWRSCPDARLRRNGRAHLNRICSEGLVDCRESTPRDTSLIPLLEMFQEVRDLLVRIEREFNDRYS